MQRLLMEEDKNAIIMGRGSCRISSHRRSYDQSLLDPTKPPVRRKEKPLPEA